MALLPQMSFLSYPIPFQLPRQSRIQNPESSIIPSRDNATAVSPDHPHRDQAQIQRL